MITGKMGKNNKTVILHFVTWYPETKDDVNGIFIRRHIELLADNFTSKHIVVRKSASEISLFYHVFNLLGFFHKAKMGGLAIVTLSQNSFLFRRFFWRYKTAIEQFQLKRLLGKYKPDLIHLHVVYGFAREAIYAKKKLGIPYVITEHMGAFPFDWLADKHLLVTEPIQKADAVIAVSEAQAKQIRDFTGVTPVVIPNVVNEQEFYYNENKTYSDTIHLVLVGIHDSSKGADYLIQVLPSYLQTHNNMTVHLVGEAKPERMEVLKKMIHERGIENAVVFHGRVSSAELCSIYHQCDFYVCASEWESFGLSLLEAMFTGLPVLSTNCGGVLDFVREDNGLLIANDRKDETLLHGLLEMTEKVKKFDRKNIAQKARARFSNETIRNKYYKIYKQVLTDRG